MGAQAGQGRTYDLPNFVGELFKVTPTDTPLLAMTGGLSGGKSTKSVQFTWQTVDNNAAEQPAIVEGADPAYESRTRAEVVNVVQIFQYGLELSYTKQAATGQLGGEAILGNQPVSNEAAFQLKLKLERAARDVEYSFLRGAYAKPVDNLTGRKTRGLTNAIATNTVAAGLTQLSDAHFEELVRKMADSGAPFRNMVLFANSFNRQKVSSIYAYAPTDRHVGGVSIKQVETDFTPFGVTYDRHMLASEVFLLDVSVIKPVLLAIPGKGHFFIEPKPSTGASDKWQLYGEIGLEYGPENWHGSITGTTTA